mmetsp:Transcript_27653/g.91896  ORF Transcript_27653/g.91896 Transcript_27653/m.91896 type:complete len:266 (+) Transcript_27653:3062-3859(+)
MHGGPGRELTWSGSKYLHGGLPPGYGKLSLRFNSFALAAFASAFTSAFVFATCTSPPSLAVSGAEAGAGAGRLRFRGAGAGVSSSSDVVSATAAARTFGTLPLTPDFQKALFTKLIANIWGLNPPAVCTIGSWHCCSGQSLLGNQPWRYVSSVVPVTRKFLLRPSMMPTSRSRRSFSDKWLRLASEAARKPKWISISNVRILAWSSSLANSASNTDHSEPSTSIFTCVDSGPLPTSKDESVSYCLPSISVASFPRQIRNDSYLVS